MTEDDRTSLLRYLDEHAAFVKELATAALENPDDPERLVELRDAIFIVREVLDELGVPYARAGNDEWDRMPSPQLLDSAIPFPLFSLPDGTLTPQWIGETGRRGDIVNLVALKHGGRDASVKVVVTGPRHSGGGVSDPLPMIAAEYLNLRGVEAATVEDLTAAIEAVLASGFTETRIQIDGHPQPFRTLHHGESWVAIHDLPPDHTLYVLGRGFPLAELRLERVTDLRYFTRASTTSASDAPTA